MPNERISLVEQYNNKDVITQIYALKDATATAVETATTAKGEIDSAVSLATSANTKADQAITLAEGYADEIAEALTSAHSAQTEAEEALTEAYQALKSANITSDASSATLVTVTNANVEAYKEIPLANENQTGMMTRQTYVGLQELSSRVDALETKSRTAYVSFPTSDPTQAEITGLYTLKTGTSPTAGSYCIDIARGLTYQYDGTTWIKTDQKASQWDNGVAGLVKGTPASGAPGTLFAEADGTGSVNGWDALTTKVDTFINSARTAFSGFSIEEKATQIEFTMSTLAGHSNLEVIPSATETKAGVLTAKDYSRFNAKQDKVVSYTVTLTVAGWDTSAKTQSVSCAGVTSSSVIFVTASGDHFIDYYNLGVRCTGQSTDTLTFTCDTIPSFDLTASVARF